MYPITSAVMTLFENEQNQVLRITGTDQNGNSILITDANVKLNGFNIDRYSCNGDKLEVGTAVAAELTLKLNNVNGEYNSIKFEGAELYVEIGIADWSEETPTITYIPCGYFTAYEQPRSLSTITIHALDRMAVFDKIPPVMTPWTDNNGNTMTTGDNETIYFMADIATPATIANIVQQMCDRCSVTLGTDLTTLPNYNYVVNAMPKLQQAASYRDIIQWCAGVMCSNAWIDWEGKLRFSWYNTGPVTGYSTTVANRFNSDLYENDIAITGVMYTNTQDTRFIAGTAGYTIDMTGNYLAQSGIAQILPTINSTINNFTYRPFSATVINAPYLWPMDRITFVDANNVSHTTALTNVNFGINGVTAIAGKGKTEETNNGAQPNAMTAEQAYIIEKAASTVKQLDESLDQEGIFNRLTENGEMQGIYLYNGKIYINGSFIQAGDINGDRIKGGTLTLGGYNNFNGTMQVVDANGNIIATITDDGIYVTETVNDVVRSAALTDGELYFEYNGVQIGRLWSTVTTSGNLLLRINGPVNSGEYIRSLLDFYSNGRVYLSAGDNVATLDLDSYGDHSGAIAIRSGNTLHMHSGGDATVYLTADGNAEIRSTSGAAAIILKPDGSIAVTAQTGVQVSGSVSASSVNAGNGASGTFTTANGKTVTVTNGIITSIV